MLLYKDKRDCEPVHDPKSPDGAIGYPRNPSYLIIRQPGKFSKNFEAPFSRLDSNAQQQHSRHSGDDAT